MNNKLIAGILLPSFIIIVLVILSTSNIGFLLEKQNVDSVQFSDLFTDTNSATDNVLIQTITITNDFFLPKKYELPKLLVCLNDKEGIKEIQNMQVKYDEGSYQGGSDIPIFNEIFFDYNYYSKQSIDLPSNSKKQVKLFIDPKYLRSYLSQIELYRGYDELLIIEFRDTSAYLSCDDLESKKTNSAIHITIINQTNERLFNYINETQNNNALLWLTQDVIISKTVNGISHEIQVVGVNDQETTCAVAVDGDVIMIKVGTSEIVNGVLIKVKQVTKMNQKGLALLEIADF